MFSIQLTIFRLSSNALVLFIFNSFKIENKDKRQS
jgi:hypothetical protein